jgi:hypothetical protein
MRDEETSLYRYFDGDGRLLYVGASCIQLAGHGSTGAGHGGLNE